jgi:hypothetical protein
MKKDSELEIYMEKKSELEIVMGQRILTSNLVGTKNLSLSYNVSLGSR